MYSEFTPLACFSFFEGSTELKSRFLRGRGGGRIGGGGLSTARVADGFTQVEGAGAADAVGTAHLSSKP